MARGGSSNVRRGYVPPAAPAGGAAITRVQTSGFQGGAAASTTVAFTLTSPVTAGNGLVAFAGGGGISSNTLTFSSTGSPTWSVPSGVLFESGAGQIYALGYALNVPGGTTTVTVTFNGALTGRGLIVAEYSGVALAAALDKNTTGGSTAAVTNPTDAAMVTTQAGDLIFSGLVFRNATNPSSPGPGFASVGADTGLIADLAAEDMVQSAAGSIAPSFTVTGGSLPSGIVSLALKAAAGGTNATATPGVVSCVTAVPTPTILAGTGATASPVAVAGVVAVPLPSATAGTGQTATASVVAAVTSVPIPAVNQSQTVAAVRVPGAVAVPTPALSTGQTVPAVAVSAVTTVPGPVITAGGSATATPAAVPAVVSVPIPVVQAGQSVNVILLPTRQDVQVHP